MTPPVLDSADLRRELIDALFADGFLHSPRWREAFLAVPRETFVDRFTVPSRTGEVIEHDLATGGMAALEAVYTNASLLTQQDDGGSATSSSTTPSLMALMLERLDVHPGHTVCEIGTGTGYNAAILAHALGEQAVVTVDIDPSLVTRARDALRQLGHHPRLIIGDGALGVPEHAPYDRLIATCGLPRVPAAWLGHVRPGGIILVNLGYALARLTVAPDGSATGPLTDYAAFMPLRHDLHQVAPRGRDILDLACGEGTTSVGRFPDFLGERPLECLRALSYPGVHKVIRHYPDGGDVHVLGDPATGSWARAQRTRATEAKIVHSGPRDLWQEYTQLAEFWDHHGRPEPTRFGLTVRHDRTHVLYLDRPDHHVAVLT